MSLEKRVATIEQKLGISPDSASGPEIPTSMDSASSPEIPTSMDSASSPEIPPSMDSASSPEIPPSMDSASSPEINPSMDSASSPEIPAIISPAILPSMDSASAIISPAIPDSMIISLNGYNGTIKDLFDKIDSKIKNLGSASNKGKYKDRVAELRNLLGNLKKATTVQDIQTTIGSKLSFKNNNLMGGKTKRRGRKSKKSNKSKRR